MVAPCVVGVSPVGPSSLMSGTDLLLLTMYSDVIISLVTQLSLRQYKLTARATDDLNASLVSLTNYNEITTIYSQFHFQ